MQQGGKDTVLVVDDELGVRQSFNMMLKTGYNMLFAETGKQAIDVFEKNFVDLILLDINLPDINGLDLLERFMETDPNTAVIMVSAVNEVQTAVKAIKLGAHEYIIKPFIVDEVLNIIKQTLKKRRFDRGFFVGVIYGAVLGILGNVMVELFFKVYFPGGLCVNLTE